MHMLSLLLLLLLLLLFLILSAMDISLISSSSSYFFYPNSVLKSSPKCKFSFPVKTNSGDAFPGGNGKFRRVLSSVPAAVQNSTFDVVIVGAGIIGLSIARQFLKETDLSVAVVDAKVPCSGATGAGQGYVWMGHKPPKSEKWDLNKRSKQLWEEFAMELEDQGMDPLHELGWMKTGSLLIGRTPEDSAMLEDRVKQLTEAGVRAEYLSSANLHSVEPELEFGEDAAAAFVPDDCQIDAQRTVAYIEKENRSFYSNGRYQDFYHHPVTGLEWSGCGADLAVHTSRNVLHSVVSVVIATGAWSGSLVPTLFNGSNISLDVRIGPRKGHLIVLENFHEIQLRHGMMEIGYVGHEFINHASNHSTSGIEERKDGLSVSMTATLDPTGNLVLGSSRQFCGFDAEIDDVVVNHILARAGQFLPALRKYSAEALASKKIRIGHRPYSQDGKPIIGAIPGCSKVVLAAGHEGEGLAMALGTAEMVVDMVLGNKGKVDPTPYSIQGRY